MYQFSMSVNESQADWFYDIEDVLGIKIKKSEGIIATRVTGGRLNISVACENENKPNIIKAIKECLTDMYCIKVKRDYLLEKLNLPQLPRASQQLLLQTLIAFDRENERTIVEDKLSITNGLAIEGFFNFVLSELKTRWDEIAQLAIDNSSFLSNEETLNELLKFLISAINPKVLKLDVEELSNRYKVTGLISDSPFEYYVAGAEQLLNYLIDVAPLELSLSGNFSDKNLLNRLKCIFDARHDNNLSGRI